MIKQICTFYPNSTNIHTYTEYHNNEVILFQRYNNDDKSTLIYSEDHPNNRITEFETYNNVSLCPKIITFDNSQRILIIGNDNTETQVFRLHASKHISLNEWKIDVFEELIYLKGKRIIHDDIYASNFKDIILKYNLNHHQYKPTTPISHAIANSYNHNNDWNVRRNLNLYL